MSNRLGADAAYESLVVHGNSTPTAEDVCNDAAYADDLPEKKLDLVDVTDGFGTPCWRVVVEGRNGDFPLVYAEDKLQAWRVFLDYIANELDGRDHIHGD